MTAVAAQEPQLPPRLLIRAVWYGQRAVYRLTRGRIGLAAPEAGKSFGMLSLETVGRRTGKSRVAIVGYYPDGDNLVTLAMNGWGEAEPAWWLNLQANPEATVRLPDGRIPVRARPATGNERDRLWRRFIDFPGWGVDLDGLAARRPMETAVVVLEPRAGYKTSAAVAGASESLTSSHAAVAQIRERGVDSLGSARRGAGRRRLRARHLWLVPGLGIAFFANFQAAGLGVNLVPLLLFGIVPDVPRAVSLHRPFALRVHNILHQAVVPITVLLGTAVTGISPFAYIGALAWLGHIVVGWGTGDRIRPGLKADGSGPRPSDLVFAPHVVREA
jgi:deazaflavin-dependent oxidoreductase (nitroreductase family)